MDGIIGPWACPCEAEGLASQTADVMSHAINLIQTEKHKGIQCVVNFVFNVDHCCNPFSRIH